MSTPTTTDRCATVRQLAATGLSHRAIGRQLGIHHSTVARILRTTDEPDTAPPAEPERTTDEPGRASTAPPPATSGAPHTPRLIHQLPPWLVQDLNILIDPRTGRLHAPVARAIHAAAEARRATWRAAAEHRVRQARHDPATAQ